MKNTNTRAGSSSRDAFTRALATGMGMPNGKTKNAAVIFASFVNPTDRRLVPLAKQSVDQRSHTVVSIWRTSDSTEQSNLVVIRRCLLGAEFVPVDVALPRDDKALVLVSGDRQTLFFLADNGAMAETQCLPSQGIKQAIERGEARLKEALASTLRAA